MPVWLAEFSIEAPAKFAQQKSSDTGAGINRRQNEQRLEHDGEVIPILHQAAETGNAVKDLRNTQRERYGAARASAQVLLS